MAYATSSPHIQTVKVVGVRASPPIEEMERRRVAKANRIARLDPLNLRHRVPARLIGLFNARDGGRHPAVDVTQRFQVGDFYATDDAAEAMDLLAFCS